MEHQIEYNTRKSIDRSSDKIDRIVTCFTKFPSVRIELPIVIELIEMSLLKAFFNKAFVKLIIMSFSFMAISSKMCKSFCVTLLCSDTYIKLHVQVYDVRK